MPVRVKDPLAELLIEREETRRSGRSSWDSLWQSVARYLLPEAATFTEEVSPGVERSRYVLDSTGPRSLELFASFLHTMLNNPAIQWFRVRVRNRPDLTEQVSVKRWREEVERLMLEEMSSRNANLYQHLHTVYLDLGAFGTAVLFVEFRDGEVYTRAFHLGDCIVGESEAGFVDELTRQEFLTVQQAVRRWGAEALDEKTLKHGQRKTGAVERLRFLHCVFPTDDREAAPLLSRRVRFAPFASVWVDTFSRRVIRQGTYEEFPYMVPRWLKTRNEAYGRSPGIKVLPDVRMVNRMMETILRGAEKLVDPPLLLPDGGLVSPVRLFPGGLTFSEGNVKPEALIPPGASRIEVGNELLFQRQRAIERGFFVQLFQTEDTPVKTATQVLQEVDERNRAVSPMLIRTQAELFHPLVLRIYAGMMRAGRLPPPPPELVDQAIEVEYVSPLTGSQRQLEGLALLRLFEGLAPWGEIDQGIFDSFEPDDVARVMHEATGAPAIVLRTKTRIKQTRDARARLQEQEANVSLAERGGTTAAKLIAASNKG